MVDNSLDVGAPLLPVSAHGLVGVSYTATEIFGTEVATFVSSDSVYRETLYTVTVPYDESLRDKVISHMNEGDLCAIDPWVYLREKILVSELWD